MGCGFPVFLPVFSAGLSSPCKGVVGPALFVLSPFPAPGLDVVASLSLFLLLPFFFSFPNIKDVPRELPPPFPPFSFSVFYLFSVHANPSGATRGMNPDPPFFFFPPPRAGSRKQAVPFFFFPTPPKRGDTSRISNPATPFFFFFSFFPPLSHEDFLFPFFPFTLGPSREAPLLIGPAFLSPPGYPSCGSTTRAFAFFFLFPFSQRC